MAARKAPPRVVTIAHMQAVCVLYIAAWCLFPPLAVDTIWRVLVAGAFAAFFGLEILRNGLVSFYNWPSALVALFLVYTATVQFVVGGAEDLLRAIQMHIVCVCALIGIAYRGARWRELSWTLPPILALLAISMALTVMELRTDPHAARIVVRTSAEAIELLRSGVGGYQLVYAAVVLAPLLLLFLLKGKGFDPPFTVLVVTLLLAAWATILSAGYSIALVIALLGSAIALFARVSNPTGLLLQAAVAALICAFAFLAVDPILAGAESFAEGTKYFKKIADLRASLDLGESVGTASHRLERYSRSASLFLGSPFLGTLTYEPIGKHSQLLDTFARYGGLMGIVGLYLLVRLPATLLPPMPTRAGHAPVVVMVTVGLFLLLNNATAAHGAAVYILTPALAYAFGRRVAIRDSRLFGGSPAPLHTR
ncbi:MAG: hypothetical protein AAGB11_04690 [Pseudomonadota bacterium]